MVTPGLSYYSKEFTDIGSNEQFAEAAVRLTLVDPDAVTGRTIGHLDVLSTPPRVRLLRAFGALASNNRTVGDERLREERPSP